MSYLSAMPWTLQKRLLRYLLSQLDFLETEDLDLDNLGITWGQRSVVQLKDVGLKAKRLSSVLRLPASVIFVSARISLLKLTVPADILTSGVAVDIYGVQVQVRAGQEDVQQRGLSRREQHKAPAKGTKANRPRIATPTVHDPGGLSRTARYRSLDESLLYPDQAAHYLAESFLQTESKEGRSQLQAAIKSRSDLGKGSPSSNAASEAEAGIGTGEGYTLPSFIASYLVGITDRIQVHVKDLSVLVDFGQSTEGQNSTQHESASSARLLVKISEIGVDPVGVSQVTSSRDSQQRKIWLDRLDVYVLPDLTAESPIPGSSGSRSPLMVQSQMKPLSVPRALAAAHRMSAGGKHGKPNQPITAGRPVDVARLSDSESSESYSSTVLHDEPPSPNSVPPSLDSSVNDSMTFRSSSPRSSSLSSQEGEASTTYPFASFTSPLSSSSDDDISEESATANHNAHTIPAGLSMRVVRDSDRSDNAAHASGERLHQSDQPFEPPIRPINSANSVEDLTESKIFTHDQAESMYASAMGPNEASEISNKPMPGGWNWSEQEKATSHATDGSEDARSVIPSTPKRSPNTPVYVEAGPASESPSLDPDVLRPTGGISIDGVWITLPQTAKRLLSVSLVSLWLPTGQTSENRGKPIPENAPSNADHGAEAPQSISAIDVDVAYVHCQFDMQAGKTLIAIAKSNSPPSPQTDSESGESAPSIPLPTMSTKIHKVEITLLENVPEQATSNLPTDCPSDHDELLLSVSLAGFGYHTSALPQGLQHRMRLREVSLSHSRGQFLSFSNETKMKASLMDSQGLQEDDVEIVISPNTSTSKIHVHTKAIQLTLDLSLVDDILSRSGGLSSLLELGSSIASTSTVRTRAGQGREGLAKTHGVRFAGPPRPEVQRQSESTLSVGKINFRMGGFGLLVVGSECRLKATTSAIKIVYRTEGIGMQIDRISVEGPILLQGNEPPQLSANIHNMRVEYLQTPSDQDLDHLLKILTPSKDRYEADDDIMVDTLLRQRRKGGVLRLTVTSSKNSCDGTSHMAHLTKLCSELSKLSTVAKYLPEDDRPGILCLSLVKNLEIEVDMQDQLGTVQLKAQMLEGAHVNVPSLIAAQVGTLLVKHNQDDRLLGEAVSYSDATNVPPMIMCRFVADEMDPTVKVKLFNLCAEYRVSFIIALQKRVNSYPLEKAESTSDSSLPSIAAPSSQSNGEGAAEFMRKTNISMSIRDCALGITPRDVNARAVLLLIDAFLSSPLDDNKTINIKTEVRKASLMVIEKMNAESPISDTVPSTGSPEKEDLTTELFKSGFVTVAYISSAMIALSIVQSNDRDQKTVDVEFNKALLILETCADSTQTLIKIMNGLSPPAMPVKEESQYRTEIIPIEDLLASFTGDAFFTEPGPSAGLRASERANANSTMSIEEEIEYLSESHQSTSEEGDETEDEDAYEGDHESLGEDNSYLSDSDLHSQILYSEIDESTISISVAPVSINESVMEASHHDGLASSLLDFRQDHFGASSGAVGAMLGSGPVRNVSGIDSKKHIVKPPLMARIRDVHIIWNLYDGYDWQSTRDAISDAVKDIEAKAAAQRPKSRSKLSPGMEAEEEAVIGDFLFNSVYIGIPVNKDPRELASEINRDIDDHTSETGSYATSTTITRPSAGHQSLGQKPKKLKLKRSRRQKMTIELQGVAADMVVFPSGSGEVQNSIDLRVRDLEIFDHIPTSTWKKFATYMRDAGEREANTSMIHIEILNVKPVPDLAASEIVLKITVLPLRLHVDQDAVDFMSRFFEFKSETAPTESTPSTPPFLQRVEVNPIRLRLDFKPKRVDYGGLRSGRTTEFMNFFILDQADMILRRIIVYGVSGFDRLGIMLNNIWTPDVKRNQLPGILSGLAPIRSLVNVGSGVKDLVVVPMREYKKDGRVVRSIQKGALAFAKTTSKELVGLGAKLAIGTQTVLQTAETMLAPSNSDDRSRHTLGLGMDDHDADEDDDDYNTAEARKQISLYADQPIGVVQGLRSAYSSLERDLLLARDAIIAVPGEAMASGSARGAAKAVLKQAPTVILRPAIGASKAVGHTLLGAGNTLDGENWRRMDEKYKRY